MVLRKLQPHSQCPPPPIRACSVLISPVAPKDSHQVIFCFPATTHPHLHKDPTHTFLSQGNGLQGDQGGDLSPWQMTCSGPVLPPWGHFLPVGNGSGQLPQPFWERCPLTSLVSLDTIRSARAHPENGHPGVLVTQYTGNGKSSRQLPLQLITAQLHSASS